MQRMNEPKHDPSFEFVLERLFVYGSLKCGGEAHHLLADCPRDQDGVLSHVQLKIHRGYPMLHTGNGRVEGEVYWISNTHWPDLDAWEDAPNTYQKKLRSLDEGRTVWVYEAA